MQHQFAQRLSLEKHSTIFEVISIQVTLDHQRKAKKYLGKLNAVPLN